MEGINHYAISATNKGYIILLNGEKIYEVNFLEELAAKITGNLKILEAYNSEEIAIFRLVSQELKNLKIYIESKIVKMEKCVF